MSNKMITMGAAAFAAVGLAAAGHVQASTTYQFTGQTPGTTSTPANGVFTGGFYDGTHTYVTPANGSGSYLQFNGTNAYTATDDGSVNSIGQLSFGSGSNATVALNGTSLSDSGALSNGSNTTIIENGSNTTAVTLTNTGGSSFLNANIQDGGTASLSLVTGGSAYLRLFGANAYSGGTTIGGSSTIEADNNSALGTGLITLSGGTISVAGSTTTLTNNITGSGNLNPYNANLTLNGSLTGSGTFTRTGGSDSVYLGGNNSGFTGTFTATNGALRFNSATSGSAAALWIDNTGGNQFSLDTAGNFQLGGLQGSSTSGAIYNASSGAVTLTLGGRNDVLDNYSGSIGGGNNGGISASISVVKTGTGTQQFSGANVYTQGTTVSSGTLLVTNTTGSATGTGAVGVSSGATLAGTGIITGAVTVNAGGILSPGDANGTGTLTLSGGLTLANSSVLDYTLAAPNVTGGTGGNDLVSTAALSLGTGVTLNITQGAGFGAGVYHLIDYTGSLTGGTNLTGWTISGLTGNESGVLSLGSDGSGNAINLTVSVPEPASLGLLAVGSLGLFLARRRKIS